MAKNSLKGIRQLKGITQQQMQASTGLTQAAISNMESGKAYPKLDNLEKYAQAIGCVVALVDSEGRIFEI